MRLVMMGTGSFAEPTLQALLASAHPVVGLVTQPDRAAGTERGSTRQARPGMKEMAQEAVPIGPEDTAGDLEKRLAPLGARLALTVIEQIAAGTATGRPQDKTQVSKAPKLTKENGLIDWTRPAQAICRQVRAMQPWP